MSEPTTIRESLEAAFGKSEEKSEPQALAVQTVSSDEQISPEAGGPVSVAETEPVAADLNTLAEQGKALPEAEQDKPKKPESAEITPGPKAGPKATKAPASWRPELREQWGKIPDSIKEVIAKREYEIDRTLKETAEARQYVESITKTFAPYEAYIKAEGATPMQVIDNLMGTAVRLRTATGPELAGLMAGMVQQFGTGRFGNQFIEMLDSALAGNAPKTDPGQAQLQQVIQQQLAPVQQFMQQFQQAQAAQQAQTALQASNEVEDFIGKTEFGNDVRQEMADLLEVAQRRGQQLSLSDAYRQACMLNPSVRQVLMQRSKTKSAQNQTAVAQRAKAAAVSVPSSGPTMAFRQEPNDIRSAIEAAIAMTGR